MAPIQKAAANAWKSWAVWILFFGFLFVGLNVVRDPTVYDKTLIPRLLALSAFLLLALPVVPLFTGRRPGEAGFFRDPIVGCSTAFTAITALSLVFAINPTAGFTDVFKTFAAWLVLCLSCLLLPLVSRWQEAIVRIVVVAAAVSSGTGWATMLARHGLGIHGREQMEQITGLTSSANLYAHFLVLLLPLVVVGILILRGGWRIAAAAVALATLSMILLLQTRSAWLGLAAGSAAGIAAAVAFSDSLGLTRRARGAILGMFLVGIGGVVAVAAVAPDSNPIARRLRSIVVEREGETAMPREGGRMMIWGITSRMIADHPLTGVGAGNFTLRLQEYYGDDDSDFSRVATNWLQPHNDFLWVFAEKGIFGLMAFVGIFASALLGLRTILRSGPTPAEGWFAVGLLTAIVAYLVGSCFDFPLERVSHQAVLAVYLAAVVVMRRRIAPPTTSAATIPWRILVPLGLTVLGAAIAYSLAARRQEQAYVKAMLAMDAKDWPTVVAEARRARTIWKTLDPVATPITFTEGMGLLNLGRLEEAKARLEEARSHNPNRMEILNNLGVLYANGGDFPKAIECFSIVSERYPGRVEGFLNLANCYMECGHDAEAAALLEQIPEPLRSDPIRAALKQAQDKVQRKAEERVRMPAGDPPPKEGDAR